jgi:hypothetical protein
VTFQLGYVYVIYCSWIKPPHDKISLCIDDKNSWFFWFNSEKKVHGIGQVAAPQACHGAIVKDCFLDISGVKTFSPNDLATARDRGPLVDPFRTTVRDALTAGVSLLPASHRDLALVALK